MALALLANPTPIFLSFALLVCPARRLIQIGNACPSAHQSLFSTGPIAAKNSERAIRHLYSYGDCSFLSLPCFDENGTLSQLQLRCCRTWSWPGLKTDSTRKVTHFFPNGPIGCIALGHWHCSSNKLHPCGTLSTL